MTIQFGSKEVEGVKKLLSSPQNIVITTHHRPDGDAIGSSLGLFHYLEGKGHRVTVITSSDFPDFLYWMSGTDKILNFAVHPSKASDITNKADLIFCLDFNQLNRLDKYEEPVS